MRVVIAGGHGKIALLLVRQLADAGHDAIGLIRNPDHSSDVSGAGGEAVVLDLESATEADVAETLRDADAVVFAAGAGPNSGAERKLTVDRDGATLLATAADAAGVGRYIMISAMGADDFDLESEDVFQIYLRAKSDADGAIRGSGLEWTIVRPGGLTDDAGTGHVAVAESTGRGTIPRADVAAVVVHCLQHRAGVGEQFEVISGETAIEDALPPS